MRDLLEALWTAVKALLWVADKIVRTVILLAGIRWLLSAKYRDEVAQKPWYLRWLVYDGAFEVVLTAVAIIALGIVGFISFARHP